VPSLVILVSAVSFLLCRHTHTHTHTHTHRITDAAKCFTPVTVVGVSNKEVHVKNGIILRESDLQQSQLYATETNFADTETESVCQTVLIFHSMKHTVKIKSASEAAVVQHGIRK